MLMGCSKFVQTCSKLALIVNMLNFITGTYLRVPGSSSQRPPAPRSPSVPGAVPSSSPLGGAATPADLTSSFGRSGSAAPSASGRRTQAGTLASGSAQGQTGTSGRSLPSQPTVMTGWRDPPPRPEPPRPDPDAGPSSGDRQASAPVRIPGRPGGRMHSSGDLRTLARQLADAPKPLSAPAGTVIHMGGGSSGSGTAGDAAAAAVDAGGSSHTTG